MGRIWFSSDWHINHTNIAGKNVSKWKAGYRNFSSTHEMNKTIFNTINKYIKPEDTLYFLGDFCFGNHSFTPIWRNHIACSNIHICRGNHDIKIDLYKDSFSSIQDVLFIKCGKHSFFLSHYAHRVWPKIHKESFHLYGHSHGNMSDYGNSMDIGIDVAYRLFKEYRPFSIEEVISLVGKRKVKISSYEGLGE